MEVSILLFKKRNPNLNFEISLFPQPKTARIKIQKSKVYGMALTKIGKQQPLALTVMNTFSDPVAAKNIASALGMAPAQKQALVEIPSDLVTGVLYKSAIISRTWLVPSQEVITSVFSGLVNTIQSGVMSPTAAVSEANTSFIGSFGGIVAPSKNSDEEVLL